MYTTIAIIAGVLIDFCLGDPQGWPHPICLIGKLISKTEVLCRGVFPKTEEGERAAGCVLWLVVVLISWSVSAFLLLLAWQMNPWLYFVVAAVMSYQIMATKCLREESRKVYNALREGDLERARYQVSMIVGRDTDVLDEQGIARAAVETVAENTSDGSIAPLFFLALGGPAVGFLYKAVNTMDSMIGYRNEKYYYFGWAAAKMDDLFNFIPSRLAAIFMTVAAFLGGMDGRQAWKIYCRDRRKSPSPNSAQTESVCAGALHLTLLGDTVYSGVIHHKEKIGDDWKQIEPEDINRANRLLYLTVVVATVMMLVLRIGILWFVSDR